MAALDFGMAMARGMLPTSEKAQKDLIDLAGGRNIFKSEDWWNKQVDKQISEGYREAERQTGYLSKTGEVLPQAGTTTRYYTRGFANMKQYYSPNLMMGMGQPNVSGQYGMGSRFSAEVSPVAPEGALKIGEENVLTRKSVLSGGPDEFTRMGVYYTKPIDVFTANATRKDYTAGELSDIEAGAKAGAQRARRQTEQSKASQKRMRKGTGGLLAKAATPESTGLPALGTTGLGLTAGLFGAEQEL